MIVILRRFVLESVAIQINILANAGMDISMYLLTLSINLVANAKSVSHKMLFNTYTQLFNNSKFLVKNPCYEATKNDCDLNAFCVDLKNNRYNCTCKGGYRDKSRDPSKPGRLCTISETLGIINYFIQKHSYYFFSVVDECLVPHLHNCSANAKCRDLDDGYECDCKDGYLDKATGQKGRFCDPGNIYKKSLR